MTQRLAAVLRLLATRGPRVLLRASLAALIDACRQRRLRIDATAGIRHVARWRLPTGTHFMNAMHRRLGLPETDFRRRATCADTAGHMPAVPPARATLLLAGRSALDDVRIKAYLLAKAAAGTLQIVGPGDDIAPQPGILTLLSDIAPDAEGQACLLELQRRGITCVWLSGPDNTLPEETPLREACQRRATPVPDGSSLDYSPITVPPAPTFARTVRSPRPLRVLTYRWHVPHQYELFKLGADFALVADLGERSCGWWDLGQRPLPANARFVRWNEIDPRDFDLAILHFDENILSASADAHSVGTDWGATFRFLQRHLTIPRIAVCHGTPPTGADMARMALVDFLGDTPVVVNSHQALAEWGFAAARVIWQGFDPAEFPCRPPPAGRAPRILTLPAAATAERPGYRGAELFNEVAARIAAPMEPLCVAEPNLLLRGNAYAAAKFAHYLAALHGFDIYFNPTLRSPMPRSRGEAMLCGLATVNAASHDVDRFIDNGVNGFYAGTADELADRLRFLLADPDRAWRIGQAGRATAMRLFHIDRYLADWRRLIRDTLGSDAI
ncbi:MAG: glycosyltransferase [Rhodocyclaceae bacterium]|jgi:hypothetical protein|nr:glycosyltransferase [Rhodocyclaceae bacterium]